MANVSFSFFGQTFRPLPCGAVYWPSQSLLLAADLHLEKGSSLARAGWMLPPYDSIETLERLRAAVCQTAPERLLLLGDSFHDRDGARRLPDAARQCLLAIAEATRIVWIAGNHDGLSAEGLPGRVAEHAELAGIRLVHEPVASDAAPVIAGHFHPKVTVPLGRGRSTRRHCIALGTRAMILPAYGAYAGGLDIAHPAITSACGGPATAIVPTASGLLCLSPSNHGIRSVA